jgi:hypothetical protein
MSRLLSCCAAASAFLCLWPMSRRAAWLLALLLLNVADRSVGAVFQPDWKMPGDGLITCDDVNQREWLELTLTTLADQFQFPGVDRDAKYQYVVSQTVLGGLFEGFTAAKSPDVVALAQLASIETSTQDFATNSTATVQLSNLLGYTIRANEQSRITDGLLDEFDPFFPIIRRSAELVTFFSSQSGLLIGAGQFQYPSPPGVMLYRHAIPEPSSFVSGLLVGLAIGICRRFGRRVTRLYEIDN